MMIEWGEIWELEAVYISLVGFLVKIAPLAVMLRKEQLAD